MASFIVGLLAVLIAAPTTATAAPIPLSNATTEVVVYGGEADSDLVGSGGYFTYTDLTVFEETTWSVDPLLRFSDGTTAVLSNGSTGGFGSPTDIGGGVIESVAVTSGITTTAHTELIGSNARTTFTFEAEVGSSLDGTTFIFYAENDLFGFADDAAAFEGSIAGDDLVLYQYDTSAGGLTVRMTDEAGTGSTLTLFGAGLWTEWGTALEGGDLSVLSADGSNFETIGDLGLALAFSLSGESATLVINYDTQAAPPAIIPEPSSIALLGIGVLSLGIGFWRRRR